MLSFFTAIFCMAGNSYFFVMSVFILITQDRQNEMALTWDQQKKFASETFIIAIYFKASRVNYPFSTKWYLTMTTQAKSFP